MGARAHPMKSHSFFAQRHSPILRPDRQSSQLRTCSADGRQPSRCGCPEAPARCPSLLKRLSKRPSELPTRSSTCDGDGRATDSHPWPLGLGQRQEARSQPGRMTGWRSPRPAAPCPAIRDQPPPSSSSLWLSQSAECSDKRGVLRMADPKNSDGTHGGTLSNPRHPATGHSHHPTALPPLAAYCRLVPGRLAPTSSTSSA